MQGQQEAGWCWLEGGEEKEEEEDGGGGKKEKSHSAFSAPLSARGEERMKPGGLVARTGPSTEEGRKEGRGGSLKPGNNSPASSPRPRGKESARAPLLLLPSFLPVFSLSRMEAHGTGGEARPRDREHQRATSQSLAAAVE